MATAAFCATRASFAAPTRADAARGRARAIRWRAAARRASPASPSAEPSSFRLDDARGASVRVARLRRLARRAVVDTRHPPALFDDRDGRRDAAERAPLDGAAEGETRDVDADAGGDAHHVGEEKKAPLRAPRNDATRNPLAREGMETAATAAIDGPTADMREGGSNAKWPWWVHMLNRSLETHPGFVLLGFVCVDMGSALCLLFLITKMKVAVDADFALAYALSKSIRAPRLALDAAVAAELARRFPALAAVRVGPILDAGVQLGAELKNRALNAALRFSSRKTKSFRFRGLSFSRGARGARDARESRSRRAAREAREMTDAYGLAYMTAKNVIGPVSIALFYAALKYGVDLRGALAAAGANVGAGAAAAAGETAGALALASWVSTVFFPLVVLGAGFIGPKMGRAAERAARGVRRAPRVFARCTGDTCS